MELDHLDLLMQAREQKGHISFEFLRLFYQHPTTLAEQIMSDDKVLLLNSIVNVTKENESIVKRLCWMYKNHSRF